MKNQNNEIIWRTFISILILILSNHHVDAQYRNSRISIDLYNLFLKSNKNQINGSDQVPILIKGNPETVRRMTLENDGYFKYQVGDISSVNLPINKLGPFIEDQSIERLEYRIVKGEGLFYEDSTLSTNNNLNPAHNGWGILPQGFRGEGTILGIIDDGFEWRHPDFLNIDSSSRIKYLWDQEHFNPNFTEQYYGYGSTWNEQNINAGLITHTPLNHGSHVLGTAAGNARASNKFIGVAPESEIIAVSYVEGSPNFLQNFVDGIHFIFNKATLLGKPCAINSSLGSYFGSKDGKDLYTALIDSMLTQSSGRALIQAAGNARQFNTHWQASLQSTLPDTARVWLQPQANLQSVYTFLYADTADFNQINFSLEWIDRVTFQRKGQTRTFNILQDFNLSNGQPFLYSDTLFYVNGFPVELYINIEQWAGTYELTIQIYNNQNTSDYWQLTTSGTGKVDMWTNSTVMGTSNMILNGNASHYKNPDNNQTMVGFWTCSDKVITVSSYQNLKYMKNYSGDTIALFTAGWLPPGISHFSSIGPTRDGRQKPDITAPGGQVLSAAPLSTLISYRNSGNNFLDEDGWHISNRGTSMAAPSVAGAAALYFQCRPWATSADLKQALQTTARIDSTVFLQTMQLPNKHWGYGKLDVYDLLVACMVYGCTDSTAINYNNRAHIDDGSCDYTIVPTSEINHQELLMISPNPFDNSLNISYEIKELKENTEVIIIDVLGRFIYRQTICNDSGSINIEGLNLTAGIYHVILKQDQKILKNKKAIKY